MNLMTASEIAESLNIDPKTFYRWREAGMIKAKGGSEKQTLFDLADGVAILANKKRRKKNVVDIEDQLMDSILRRWKSKVAISRQALENHKEAYVDYSELLGLWHAMISRATTAIGKLPSTIAKLSAGIEDIATVAEIVRTQVYATLSKLSESDYDDYLDTLPGEVDDDRIEAPDSADISDLIEIERTRQNNLVSELNERRALVAAGKLLNVELAEKFMTSMVGIARSKLMALSGGFARVLACQERADIVKILKKELELVTDELNPELPTGVVESEVRPITADEVTSRDIVELPEEHEDEEND